MESGGQHLQLSLSFGIIGQFIPHSNVITIVNIPWVETMTHHSCLFTAGMLMLLLLACPLTFSGTLNTANEKTVQSPRMKLLMDRGWKFHLGDAADPAGDFNYGSIASFAKAGDGAGAIRPDFNDSSWRAVDLPHDWAVEQEFVKSDNDDVKGHGYKPIGRMYPKTTIGWYRRTLVIPKSDEGKRLAVKFDGVFRDCIVWINGHYLGNNLSGYSEFSYDITDYVNYGARNVLVVRVDASQYEGWFYEGAGIYRHTWFLKYDPVNVPEYGIFVHTTVGKDNAVVSIETRLANEGSAASGLQLRTIIVDADGHNVGTAMAPPVALAEGKQELFRQQIAILHPRLWSLEHPTLYKLISSVYAGERILDTRETTFGIRTITFDKDRGCFLNGQHVELKGVCCHQDHAGVGSALPDRLQYFRIERLKEMGCNAYRTSHNPPTPELLEACDRLGMLVMDENRLMGSSPEMMAQFERLVLRDRNHPSVIMWSLGNEEYIIQNSDIGKRIALSLERKLKELDPTRIYSYAANNGNHYEGINSVLPLRGFNYMTISDIDKYRRDHPDQMLFGSEEASTLCTRGIYANDTARGYMSDYDEHATNWGATAEHWWRFYAQRPWLAGAFVWTGFDYRGEPTPYSWPCINSHFGIMDMCGFPKNVFYYYQAWWSDRDVLHLAPHWNWTGKEGKKIKVWCESNCDRVELFLNGRSLGNKAMEINGHLEWDVPYEPGTLKAQGWRQGRLLTTTVQTTGAPAVVQLSADRTTLLADGEDISLITVSAKDREGREVPIADNLIQFRLKGNGKIIGVGNGDPSSHEPDKFLTGSYQRRLFNGKCQLIVQTLREQGTIEITGSSEGLDPGTLALTSTIVQPRASVERDGSMVPKE